MGAAHAHLLLLGVPASTEKFAGPRSLYRRTGRAAGEPHNTPRPWAHRQRRLGPRATGTTTGQACQTLGRGRGGQGRRRRRLGLFRSSFGPWPFYVYYFSLRRSLFSPPPGGPRPFALLGTNQARNPRQKYCFGPRGQRKPDQNCAKIAKESRKSCVKSCAKSRAHFDNLFDKRFPSNSNVRARALSILSKNTQVKGAKAGLCGPGQKYVDAMTVGGNRIRVPAGKICNWRLSEIDSPRQVQRN